MIATGEQLQITPALGRCCQAAGSRAAQPLRPGGRRTWRRRTGWAGLRAVAGLPEHRRAGGESTVYVVDQGGSPVRWAWWAKRGSGVCRWRRVRSRPRLTAEQFVADPFGREPGRRLPDGDLARWRGAGRWGGRTGVSGTARHEEVRGFRVELGRSRRSCWSTRGVREAVVLLRECAGEAFGGVLRGGRGGCRVLQAPVERVPGTWCRRRACGSRCR